jgi:hypothetical protein
MDIHYQSKDKYLSYLKWKFNVNDAKPNSIVARVSEEEIKMAKTRDQAKSMDSEHERVAKVRLLVSRDFEGSYPSLTREAIKLHLLLWLIS